MNMTTKSQEAAKDVAALLRARNPLLWIVTREEARVEASLFEAAASANYIARTWDVAQGVADISGVPDAGIGGADPGDMLKVIQQRALTGSERAVWLMRDLAPWLRDLTGASTCRGLRNLARMLPGCPRERAQAVIVISPSGDVPPELAGHATVIEWPLPDREEIAAIMYSAVESLPDEMQKGALKDAETAIDAAVGLTGEEAASCYARSLVQTRTIDPATVAREKKRVVAREGVLEWFDPIPQGLDAVGGLDALKRWLEGRKNAYTPEAKAYGLPAPKGALLVGVPGCGKSLSAKAVATAWECPLLRLDLGALKSKFVGESEGNLRKALEVINSVGRCVVWLDEIEKALAGATQGGADGGVSSDALGTILSWMQDRPGEAFVIATSNDVSALPPELLRKGRFDELWFVDLPTTKERVEIVKAALRSHGRQALKIDAVKVAEACADFTGSEIAAIVPDALYAAFADKRRQINTNDLVDAASKVVPLAKTASDKIAKLRDWANGRARRATTPDVTTTSKKKLDL
jgi:AAA+ superfamily predicted ATPase